VRVDTRGPQSLVKRDQTTSWDAFGGPTRVTSRASKMFSEAASFGILLRWRVGPKADRLPTLPGARSRTRRTPVRVEGVPERVRPEGLEPSTCGLRVCSCRFQVAPGFANSGHCQRAY